MRASTATQVVAGSGRFAFDLTVPGGQVKATGLTIVGVLPTHRRRGYLRGMMRSQIDAARERGERVAVLWATEDTIYGRFGYGIGLDGGRDRHAARARGARSRGSTCRAQARLVTLAEAEPLIAPVYERVARETPGMYRAHVRLVAGPAADRPSVAAAGRRRAALRGLGASTAGRRPTRSIASTRRSSAASPPATSSWSRRWASRRRRPTRSGAFCSSIDFVARAQGDLPAARSPAADSRSRRRAG